MRVCILGGSGLVGSALHRYLKDNHIEVLAPSSAEIDVVREIPLKEYIAAHRPRYIFNCAAYTQVDNAEKEPEHVFALNALAPRFIAEAAAACGGKLIHLSTDYVFDGAANSPYREEDPCHPLNVYGKTKREGELAVFVAMPFACIVRTSWVFGPKGKNFVSSILHWLKTQEVVSAVTDQVSKPTYVFDLVKAVWQLRDASGIFHVANRTVLSRFAVAEDIRSRAQNRGIALACHRLTPALSSDFPNRAQRPSYSALDTGKIEKEYGIVLRGWEEIIEEYLNEHAF